LVLSGKTLTEAAPLAGYSGKWAGQSGHQAMVNIKEKIPDLFARHGLDDDSFIEKHVIPALNATETKAHFVDGKWRYSRAMAAVSARNQANRLVAEMKGMIVGEQDKPLQGIKVVVINQAHRPPRDAQRTAIDIPGLTPPGAIQKEG
jgi:hypothetical protein